MTPSQTTTYTITVNGSGTTTATAQATVKVTPAAVIPTVTISANPQSISAGQSSTLTVTATNSTNVVITDNVDSNSYPLAASGGTQSVSPTATTIYTATATGQNNQTATALARVSVTPVVRPTVTVSANPTSISAGQSSTLTVTATNSTNVVITDNVDSNSYPLAASGGTQSVSPTATTIYTATATGPNNQTATASATVKVSSGGGNLNSINHVIFMQQENRTFDTYFGMLNPYRHGLGFNIGDDGKDYEVDGIDDKLSTISNTDDEGDVYPIFKFTTTCVDDETSAWLESYGDVNRYDFLTTRQILTDGFVHTAEGFAKSCAASGTCSGNFTDLTGRRSMGYYDQTYLNYYYYMASQFALSDRWFSPVSSKSIPNRIATFTGGTTEGLVRDPGNDDHLSQLNIRTIFQELDEAKVSWKLYYTVTDGSCLNDDECSTSFGARFPATVFDYFTYSDQFLYANTLRNPTTWVIGCTVVALLMVAAIYVERRRAHGSPPAPRDRDRVVCHRGTVCRAQRHSLVAARRFRRRSRRSVPETGESVSRVGLSDRNDRLLSSAGLRALGV